MKLAKVVWLLILILLMALVTGVACLMVLDYDDIIRLALEQLQRPDLKKLLEEQYFTPSKYTRLRRTGYSVTPILLALFGFCILKRKKIISALTALFDNVKSFISNCVTHIQECHKSIKISLFVLLILVLIRSIFYALHFYPQYDECWNYNYFLSNNFFVTFFAYNNYPLHNILTFLTLKALPDTTFVMRLPNIIIGLLNILLVFVLAKRLFKSEKIGIISSTLFAVLPTAVFYFLFARGVMLALLFTILLLYFFLLKPLSNWSLIDRFAVIIIGSLGCYSMISFPIFLIVLFLIYGLQALIKKNGVAFRNLIWIGFGTLFSVIILYLPMILGTGVSLGVHSDYTASSIQWNEYFSKASFLSRNQIGFYWGSYLFIGMNILLLLFSQRKRIIALNIVLLLLPLILPLLLKTYLPARALSFQLFAYLFSIILVFELFYKKVSRLILIGSGLLLIIGFNYISTTHTFFDWSARPDKGAFEMAEVLQRERLTSYYDLDGTFSYFVPSILYHHKLKKKTIQYNTSNKRSARFTPLKMFQGDCFVVSYANYISQAKDIILYKYEDEDKAFILYRRPSSEDEELDQP